MKVIIFAIAATFLFSGLAQAKDTPELPELPDTELGHVVSAIIKLKANCSVNSNPECKEADAVLKLLKRSLAGDSSRGRQIIGEAMIEAYIEADTAEPKPN